MKTIIFLSLLTIGFSNGNAFAQDSLHVAPRQVSQVILEKLDHEVTLTSKQKKEVRKLLLERSEKFSQVQQSAGAKKLASADFRQANQQALSKLKLVLTPQQFAKIRSLRQESQRQKAAYKEEVIYKTLQDIELDF